MSNWCQFSECPNWFSERELSFHSPGDVHGSRLLCLLTRTFHLPVHFNSHLDSWQEVVFPCGCGLCFPASVGLLFPSLVKYLLSLVGISFSQALTMVEWADISAGIELKGISDCRVYFYFHLEPEKFQKNWDWIITFMVAKMIPRMMVLYDFRV